MDTRQFEQEARRDGFLETFEKQMGPGEAKPEHSHPFDLRGIVLEGQLTIACAEAPQQCGPGETFVLNRDILHQEIAGDEGARYFVAKRQGN